MIKLIHVSGYRSVRELTLELQPINVLTGPNGCGKSNLYNSLVLIGRAAQGQFARAIAEEGGTPSVSGGFITTFAPTSILRCGSHKSEYKPRY